MPEERPFVVVELSWLPVTPPTCLPSTQRFGATGYETEVGVEGLFSIYVLLEEEPSAARVQRARVFALVDDMENRLPSVGEQFVIAAGVIPVAQGEVVDAGTGTIPSEEP